MNISNAQLAYAALQNAGLSAPVLSFALGQAAFESTGFTSNVFSSVNNASGIEFVGQANATDSTIAKQDGGDFAAYSNLNDWATDFVRVLNLQLSGNTIGAPANATDLQDYVNRLAANNYFGAGSSTTYYNGLNSEINALSSVLNAPATTPTQDSTDDNILANAQTVTPQPISGNDIAIIIVFIVIILGSFCYLIFRKRNER